MTPVLAESLEEWILVQTDALRYSKDEALDMPAKRVLHFLGFHRAQAEMQKKEQERQNRMNQFQEFVRQ